MHARREGLRKYRGLNAFESVNNGKTASSAEVCLFNLHSDTVYCFPQNNILF